MIFRFTCICVFLSVTAGGLVGVVPGEGAAPVWDVMRQGPPTIAAGADAAGMRAATGPSSDAPAGDAQSAGAYATESTAWKALWTNRLDEAERLFSDALDADDHNGAARRGLILTLVARGMDDRLLDELEEYAKALPVGTFDYFLPFWIMENTELKHRDYYEVLYEYAKKLAESDELTVTDSRKYISQAIRFAVMTGREKEAREWAEKLNRIERWAVLGPFDNISGAGHRTDHIESWNTDTRERRGKFGQIITWFSPALVSIERVIIPNRYFARGRYTTAYLRTCVDLPEAGTYLISISHAGDMRFSINETLVHESSRFNASREILHWLVDLPAGTNLLAFKVSNRDENGAVSCAVSNPDGSAVDDLEIDPFGRYEPFPVPLNPRRLESDFLGRIARMAADEPRNAEYAFWNLRRALLEEKPETVENLCDDLSASFEHSALMQLALARAYKRIDKEDHAERAGQRAAELDSSLVQAQLLLADEALERKRPETALDIAGTILATAPLCRAALQMKMRALEDAQKMEGVRELAEEMEDALDDDPLPDEAFAKYEEHRGNKKEMRKHKARAHRHLPVVSVTWDDYMAAYEEDDQDEMREQLESILDLHPDFPWFWYAYIHTLLATDKIDEASRVTSRVLKSFPQNVRLLELNASMAEAGIYITEETVRSQVPNYMQYLRNPDGRRQLDKRIEKIRKNQAKAILTEALNCDPGNFEIRDKIRSLKGAESYRTFMPDPDLGAILERRVDPDSYAGEAAVVLIDQRRRFAFDGQASLQDHVLAVQLLGKAGIEQWETYDVGFSRDANDIVFLEKKTVKEDGSEVDAKVILGNVVFSNLEAGDVVFLHYQITSFMPGRLAGHFWDHHLFPFPDNPCLESSYIFIHPRELGFRAKLWNGERFTDEELPVDVNLNYVYHQKEWRFTDLPPIGAEPFAANCFAYLPWLDITSVGSWEVISSWYGDLGIGQTEVTGEIREKTAELTAGCSSDDEKIASIVSFVSKDINYEQIPFYQTAFVPREAGEVLQDRFGDCKDKACLLISMLEAAGVDSCYYALTTPHLARDMKFLPSPRFRHAIVCRRLPDATYRWYDPTIKYAVTDQIPQSLAGCPALVVSAGERMLTTIGSTSVEDHPYTARTHVTLDADGDARVGSASRFEMVDFTNLLRCRLETMTREDVAEELVESLSGKYPGVEFDSVRVSGRDEATEPLVYEYAYRVPEFCQVDADIISLRFPWSTHVGAGMGRIAAKKERTSPVDLAELNICEHDSVTIALPPRTNLRTVPEGASYTWGNCRYETSFERTADGIRGTRTLVITGDRVAPDEYPAFKEFLDGVRRDLKRLHHLRCS